MKPVKIKISEWVDKEIWNKINKQTNDKIRYVIFNKVLGNDWMINQRWHKNMIAFYVKTWFVR